MSVEEESLLATAIAIGEKADRAGIVMSLKMARLRRRVRTAMFFLETGRVDAAKKTLKIALEEAEI
jgi:hypothetical protein